jgi:hypothetical protein
MPDYFFPINLKIMILIISFISMTISIYVLFTYTNLFRQQIIDDKRRKLRRSNLLIAFVSVTSIWSILFILYVYNSPDKIIPFLFDYGLSLPFGILAWYVIISLIRKERYLTEHKPIDHDIIKTEPSLVSRENIEGIIISEGGYPAHGYDLIFTDQRLIVVDTGPTLGGLHIKNGDKKSMQYNGFNPEQIIRGCNCKWEYYQDIKKADLKKGMIHSISINGPSFKGKYYFKKPQLQQAEDLFNKYLIKNSFSTIL